MTRHAVRFVLVAMGTILVSSATGQEIRILRAGTFSGSDVKAESGEGWWGVFPTHDGYTLEPSPITVTPAFDGMVDAKGEMTGKKVSVPQKAEPVILIKGLTKPTSGRIDAVALPKPWNFLYPGQSTNLRLSSRKEPDSIKLAATGTATGPNQFRDYKLRLTQKLGEKSVTQTLATFDSVWGNDAPNLYWAGDIDRDGKVDLLFNLNQHYNGLRLGLFLSSAAKEGELVRLVAEWTVSGC